MGGAQRFLYELVTRLSPDKYDILVAAGSPFNGRDELFEKLALKNVKTTKIRDFSNTLNFKNFLAFWEIFKLIRNFKPDILYLLSSEAGFIGSMAGSFYRFFSRNKKPKIIYRIGGWAFKEPRNIFIKKIYLWAEKISAPLKDIIITNSEFDRQLAIKNNIASQNKITTIYNGIDTNELKFLPKEEARKFIESKIVSLREMSRRDKNYILLGTIANLYKNKGIEYLILAIAKISNDNRFNLVIIGDGPEKANLEKLIKKKNLENRIFMIGYVPNAYRYLKAFNLFVLPSIKEGQPWVILEAMAASLPIVATNIAGIPEMIENEKSGLLVEPADSEALSLAIEKMLTHPSLSQECAKNAFKTIKEKFKTETMIRQNESLF